jgi:hypothetical protein
LTVTNYYYKPSTKHEKGIYQPPNIELGFKLGFGESVFVQRFTKKRRQDIKDIGVKSIFHRGTKLRRI